MNNSAPLSASDPLAQLRDIHLPPPLSLWPPAPGWWLLAALLLVLLGAALLFWRRWRRRNAYRRAALRELRNLGERIDVASVNALLKRTALAAGWREASALSGEAWLQFLQRTCGRGAPLLEPAEHAALLTLYAPSATAIDSAQLQRIAARWIRSHRC